MGTKVTSSLGSVLEEPEIQKLQMQAKIFKENSLNKLNALKSTTQLLERQTFSGCPLYQQAFAQLFGDGVRTFKFQLSQHMNNLETQLNAETLHEMDSKSALSVIKVQFDRFINSDLLKPLDIYSRSFSSDREVRENFRDYTKMTAQTFKETIIQNMNSIEQCIVERASHEQELKMTLKKLSERQLQIQQCKVQEVQSSVTSSGDETSSGIVSDEEIDEQELEARYSFMAKIQEVLPEESSSTDQPLEQFLGDKLVSWMSKKWDYTAMSSAEVEYVALSTRCAQVMWMRTQLKDYSFNYNKIPLYCDSQSTIAISYNLVQHSHTKHIHTRYHFIKEQVENGIIELYFVRTEYQFAGMFTKAFLEEKFQYLVRRIGMRCLTPAELEVLTNEST
ncbi:hypothetical protein Tco_1476168 [Tanacetum coccineum]